MTREPTTAAEQATWREWFGLALLTLPMLALATDISSLFLAMPSLSADLQPGTSQMLWILHIYGFLIAGFLITMGRLGDRVGRRRLLMIGSGAFAVLAVVAAFAPNAETLIATRALLGVAGATLMPSAYSLLRTMFHDDSQRRYAVAIMFSAFSVGAAAGPLLSGTLLEYFWWGSVFLINVPPLVLLLLIGARFLPEHRDRGSKRLDLVSVGLSLGGMLPVVYGLQEAAEFGLRPNHVVAVAIGTALGTAFVHRQRRLADPLLDLRLFTNRRFSASLAMVLLSAIGGVGAFYLFTQYLQWVLGLSPLQAGLWTLPYVILGGVGSLLGPALVRWLPQIYVIGGGLLTGATGLLVTAIIAGSATLPAVLTVLSITALGQGAAMSLGSDLIISSAPAQRAGSAAAMQEVSGELGTALGVAVAGGVGMLVYRTTLTDTISSAVPPATAQVAKDSVAGALTAAGELPDPIGPELLEAAQTAFTYAVQAGFGLGSAIMAPVAVVVTLVLRRTRPSEAPTDHPHEPITGGAGSERCEVPELCGDRP